MSLEITTYKTVTAVTQAEYRDRGSRFIAYVYPVQSQDEIKAQIKLLKAEHPKAVHCCYAFRLGFDKTNYRANDDGEPSGSAGKPILGQIDSFEITQVLICVIRYFGGVLLGVPGLIQAYKTVAHDALIQNEIITKDIEQHYNLQFDYTLMNDVMRVLKQHQVTILSQESLLFCSYNVSIPLKDKKDILEVLRKIHGLTIQE